MHGLKSPHPLSLLADKLERRQALTKEERVALLALPCRVEEASRGKYIAREGDALTHSCVLVGGFAFSHKVVMNGGRAISAIHIPGDIVDLQSSLLGRADQSVQTMTDCTLGFVQAAEIKKLAFDYPSVGGVLWQDTLIDASISREWTTNIARRHAGARIAHLICELGLRMEAAGLGSRLNYEMPLTQDQLADCMGLTPVHINRSLKVLEREGLIARSGRQVTIADWDKTGAAADFRSIYLHLRGDAHSDYN